MGGSGHGHPRRGRHAWVGCHGPGWRGQLVSGDALPFPSTRTCQSLRSSSANVSNLSRSGRRRLERVRSTCRRGVVRSKARAAPRGDFGASGWERRVAARGEAHTARVDDHDPCASLGATLELMAVVRSSRCWCCATRTKGDGSVDRAVRKKWSAGGRCCWSGRREGGGVFSRCIFRAGALSSKTTSPAAKPRRVAIPARRPRRRTKPARARARARSLRSFFSRVVCVCVCDCVWVRARANDTDPPPGGARHDPRRLSRRARSPATSSPLRSSRAAGRASCGAGTPHSRRAPPSSTAAGARGAVERRRPTRPR